MNQLFPDHHKIRPQLIISEVCAGVRGAAPSQCHYLDFTLILAAKKWAHQQVPAALSNMKTNGPKTLRLWRVSGGLWQNMLFGAASPVSGLISSSSFTMPSPCMEVQCLMGEPPPILLYCSWIFGVRRFAMNGPSLLHRQGQMYALHLQHSWTIINLQIKVQ